MRRPALALLLGCLLLVAGASALDGYDYYQTIEYAGCDQDVYQQDIVIHRSTGTAYNETAGGLETWHIFVGDHCQADYDDVRFTNSTGELEYYLWPDYDSSSARFAVRLEGADAAGTVTVGYGSAAATTTSNGGAAYLFFDDFGGSEIDNEKWWVYDGSPYIQGGTMVCPSVSTVYSRAPINLNNVVVARSKLSTMGANYIGLIAVKGTSPTGPGTYGYAIITHTGTIKGHNIKEGTHETYTDFGTSEYSNEYYISEIRKAGTTNYYKTTDKNEVVKSGSSSVDSTSNNQGYLFLKGYNGGTFTADYIYVRTYSATPPAALTFSGEVESDAPQPFPGLALIPRDLAGNGLYTDINGNNRLDYNDLTVFFQNLAWAKTAQPIACFDFNGNGWLDYNDVITLFSTIMEEHT